MTVTDAFLIAIVLTFAAPYSIWRIGRTDYCTPLVVVQIIASETFTVLLLMAVGSTMLTIPVVTPKLRKLKSVISRLS